MKEPATSVLLDGIAFANTHQMGVQRYYLELLPRLPETFQRTLFFNQPVPDRKLPAGVEVVVRPEHFPVSRFDLPRRTRRKFWHLFRPTPLPPADVFHSTYFTRSPVPGVPEVVTVHDMVPECMPYFFAAEVEAAVAQKRECILNAAVIIAISQATRDDLAKVYPEVSGRVTVIHHGADHLRNRSMAAANTGPAGGGEPYFLFVGDREGYKNFATLAAALAEPAWPAQIKLKVAGRDFNPSEQRMLRYLGVVEKITHVGRVPDDRLKALFQHAQAFIFPSLCEGFGFPLLEAEQLGVPVLASDIRVFREIGGAGVVLFDPHSPHALAAAAGKILEPGERERRLRLSADNAQRFTWAACAEKTAEVFRSVARRH